MKRNIFYIILIVTFILSACGGNAAQPTPTDAPVIDTSTSTPSPTRTATPAATLTASITPLPTIPTFTPTFDARTIVTVTPASPAECPKEDPALVPDFPYCDNIGCSGGPYHEATLNYLNAGGTLDKLEKKHWGLIQDLTGDGIKEVAHSDMGYFYVYGCKEHKYEVLLKWEGTQNTPYLDSAVDLNNNGIPDLIVSNYERGAYHSIHIFEWNKSQFISLIELKFSNYKGETVTYDWLGGTVLNYKIVNRNRNHVKEIVAIDKIPYDPGDLSYGLPLRESTITLGWNGEHFVIIKEELTPPQYRFQAIQDADKLTLQQSYDDALKLYQEAIFSKRLDWWSQERKFYESKTALDTWFQNAMKLMVETATPFPTLAPVPPDTTEYPKLAAYAYYRIMLLHTIRGYESDAGTVYNTLQQKFGTDPNGRPYVEMATAFWNAYQSTHKMYDSCAAAIQYAAEHPEILIPLGSDYHGRQSHTYVAEDVCPFR